MTDEQPPAGRARTTRILVALGAAGLAAVLFILLLHTPIARRGVLGYALSLVEREYGIRVDAARLDYNLATMRIGLAGVRLSAPHAAGEPFFTADYVAVVVPWRIALGDVSFDDISVANARVFVRRRADGTTNLPVASDTPGGEPSPLRIGRLDLPQLAIDIRDEQSVMSLWVPSLAIRLTSSEGYIRLARDAEVRTETQMTRVSQLEGEAAFDGRALRFRNLLVRSDELSVQLDGALTLIAEEPVIDVDARGTADLARLARWVVTDGELPAGQLAFEAGIAGPLDTPVTHATVGSQRIAWRDVVAVDAAARTEITTELARIEDLQFGFAGGRVTATGQLPFAADGDGRVNASWSGVDAASAVRMAAPDAGIVPSGSLSGEIAAQGAGSGMERWSGDARMSVTGGRNGRGLIQAPGSLTARSESGSWMLNASHTVGGVAPVSVSARGDADGGVTGQIHLADSGLTALADLLRTTGLADVPPDVVSAGTLAGDIDVTGRLDSPVVDGRATIRDLTAPQVEVPLAEAQFRGRLLEPSLEFSAVSDAAAVAGEPVADVRASGRLAGDTLTIDEVSARQPASTGSLLARGTYDLGTGRYTAALDGSGWRTSPTADQPLAASIDVDFAGAGTADEPGGTGTVHVREAVWADRRIGDIDADIELKAGEAFVNARAPEFAATADVRVRLEAPYAAMVDGRVQDLALSRLSGYIETPTPVTGTTTLTFHGEGALDAWRTGTALVEVSSLEATAGDLALRLVDSARLRYEAEAVHVDRLELTAGEIHLSASGELPVFDATRAGPGVLVTITGDVDEVVRAATATGLTDLPIAGGDGPVALLARVTGALQAPVVAADLEVGPGSLALRALPAVSALHVRAHAEDGWIELREGVASYEQSQLSVTGKAPMSLFAERLSAPGAATGEAVIHGRATNVTPAVLAAFMEPGTLEEISGAVDLTLEAATPTLDLADLTGELRIDRLDVRIADLPVTQRVPTLIVARDGFARVEAWEWVGQGASLEVRGQVRLEDRQTAILANGVVDLRMLTPFVRDAGIATAGQLEPRLSITGTLDDPRIDGDVLVTDGELRLADPRVIVSDLTMRTVVSRTTGRITALDASINGGALSGDGTLEYTEEGGFEAQLSTRIQGMALEFPEGLRSEVDGDLGLTLTAPPAPAEPNGLIRGTVTVVRGTYREPLAVVTGLLAGLRAQGLAAAAEPSPFLDGLALDVRVLTDEDVFVDNNYGRFRIGADLRVIGTAAAPGLSGRAEIREGGQLFVGRNVYAVNFGTIDFSNPAVIEPVLNVEAATRAGGEDIEVTIRGPAESPTVDLASSSNPDLGYTELASLLLTGRLLDDLAPGDAAFVGTQVIGNFSAEVLGFASRAVGLDTLRLGGVDSPTLRRDPTAVAAELDPTTRVTFGKSLGSNVDVTYSQSLRDGDAQTWIVDYLPARGVELRLVSNDDDLRSYKLQHDIAIGSAGRAARSDTSARREALRVSAVTVAGDLRLDEARVRGILRLEAGDEFDFGAWQDDRERLERLYRDEGYVTARVDARRIDGEAGVALDYRIEAGPRTVIAMRGMDLNGTTRERLQTAWAQSVFDDFLVDEAAEIIRSELGLRGYLQPMIDVGISDEGAVRTLAIAVVQGTRTTRSAVRIEGADEPLTADISAQLTGGGLTAPDVADPGRVEDDVIALLRRRGHLRARVTAGALVFEDTSAILPLTVDPGPVFTIETVAFEGVTVVPEEDLLAAAALEAPMPYDPAAVDGARERLLAAVRREGFAAATVVTRTTVQTESPSVDVQFLITAGARQILQEVVVSGNRAIDADVVVRALDLATGQPLRPEDVLRARTRVFDTGLFRRTDVTAEPIEPPAADGIAPVRLRVTVEEWPTLRLRYGLVVAEERPEDSFEGRELVPGVSADITRRTLFGRAVGIGTALELQRREQRARVFVNTPTFFGLPVGSSLSGKRSREQFQAVSLVTNRSGITWEQRARVAGNLGLSYSYTFERDHTIDTGPPDPFAPPFDITVNIARLNAAAAWDTRDDPTDTARGIFASSTIEFAPEAAGSDIRFVRQLQQAYYFRSWRRIVFASAARLGVVVPLEGQELIVSERFFAGGSRTVRGVAEEGLGGRDFFGDATGGEAMLVLNQEVRVPFYEWLRGVVFVDAGNIFTRPRDMRLGALVGSIGAGLRLATPFALLRVDYGKPVWGAPASSGRWTFGIGQAF